MKKSFVFIAIVTILELSFLLHTGCTARERKLEGTVKLRNQYKIINEAEAKAIVKEWGFFEKRWNKYSSFPNKFQLKQVGEDKIIIDGSTNLVWHQSGSIKEMNWEDTKNWIKKLNARGYGGYKTWRLPTLSEAASLLESKRIKRCYIDPLFSPLQYSTRTGDVFNDVRHWGVSFYVGQIFKVGIMESDFVRPVAELK